MYISMRREKGRREEQNAELHDNGGTDHLEGTDEHEAVVHNEETNGRVASPFPLLFASPIHLLACLEMAVGDSLLSTSAAPSSRGGELQACPDALPAITVPFHS